MPGIVLKHVLEVRTCRICGATAHGVEVAVGLEINADRPDQGGRQVRTGRPARRRATTRNIDGASHANNAMRRAVVRISTRPR